MTGELLRQKRTLSASRSRYNLARPSDENRAIHLEQTRNAMERLIESITGEAKPSSKQAVSLRYKPKGSSIEHKLKIIEQQNDPLEPPRHRYQKPVPTDAGTLILATPETKAPILRSIPEKLTKEQKKEWEIPQSISNWKNGRGFMIDLDHRSSQGTKLAPSININKKADLAAALTQASEEVAEDRSKITYEKQQKHLRSKLLAQKSQVTQNSLSLDNSDDLFDTRLFHSGSKKRHDLYDSSLFGASTKRHKNTKTVEFERGS